MLPDFCQVGCKFTQIGTEPHKAKIFYNLIRFTYLEEMNRLRERAQVRSQSKRSIVRTRRKELRSKKEIGDASRQGRLPNGNARSADFLLRRCLQAVVGRNST